MINNRYICKQSGLQRFSLPATQKMQRIPGTGRQIPRKLQMFLGD